jgi:hypothetical protein
MLLSDSDHPGTIILKNTCEAFVSNTRSTTLFMLCTEGLWLLPRDPLNILTVRHNKHKHICLAPLYLVGFVVGEAHHLA